MNQPIPQQVQFGLSQINTAFNLKTTALLLRNIRSGRMNDVFGNNPEIVSRWVGRELARNVDMSGFYVQDCNYAGLISTLYAIASEFNEHTPFNADAFKDGFMDIYNVRVMFIVGTPDFASTRNYFNYVPEDNLSAEDLEYLRGISAIISGITQTKHIGALCYESSYKNFKLPHGFNIDAC